MGGQDRRWRDDVVLPGHLEQTVGGASKLYYTFNGHVVAMRDTSTNIVTYLHGDHLGSVSLTTNSSGAVVSKQDFDPWGKARGTSTLPSIERIATIVACIRTQST